MPGKTDIFHYYNLPALFSFHFREFSWVRGKPNCNHLGVFHSSSVILNDKCIYSVVRINTSIHLSVYLSIYTHIFFYMLRQM